MMPVETRWPWLVGSSWRPEEVLPQFVKLQRMEFLVSSGAAPPSTRVNKAQDCAKLQICAPSPSSPAGRGGEGRGRGGAAPVADFCWQRGDVRFLQRKLPSVGELCCRYFWPRGPLRASGALAPRFLLPPTREDLGRHRGSSTPVPDQVVSSPSWSRWPRSHRRQWDRWRRTGSRFTFSFEVLLVNCKDYDVILFFFQTLVVTLSHHNQ
jgi:hypothetical protein